MPRLPSPCLPVCCSVCDRPTGPDFLMPDGRCATCASVRLRKVALSGSAERALIAAAETEGLDPNTMIERAILLVYGGAR